MFPFHRKTETKISLVKSYTTTLAEKTSINFTCASCACSKALCSHRLLINCSCQWVQLLQYALYPAPHIIILRGWSSNLDQFSTVSHDLNLVMMILLWDNECIYFELQRETKKPSGMGNYVKFSPLWKKIIDALKTNDVILISRSIINPIRLLGVENKIRSSKMWAVHCAL